MDDELSKLIGKRSQIKRKKKEDIEKPMTDEPIVFAATDRVSLAVIGMCAAITIVAAA